MTQSRQGAKRGLPLPLRLCALASLRLIFFKVLGRASSVGDLLSLTYHFSKPKRCRPRDSSPRVGPLSLPPQSKWTQSTTLALKTRKRDILGPINGRLPYNHYLSFPHIADSSDSATVPVCPLTNTIARCA